MAKTESEIKQEFEKPRAILIVKAWRSLETGQLSYDWNFPEVFPGTSMIGVLEMIKSDLLDQLVYGSIPEDL